MFSLTKRQRRCLAGILCLLLLIPSLFSCRDTDILPGETTHRSMGVWKIGEPFAFPDDCRPVYCNFSYCDGKIFSKVYDEFTVKLGITDPETGNSSIADFPGYSYAVKDNEYADVAAFTMLPWGGFAVVWQVNGVYLLIVTEENGALRTETVLDDFKMSSDHVLGMLYSPKNDTLYPYSQKYIAAVKPDGTRLYRVNLPYLIGCSVTTGGEVYAVYYNSSGADNYASPSAAPLDDMKKSLGTEYPLPENINLWNGKLHFHPDFDLCYTTNGSDGVYACSFPENGEAAEPPVRILDFVNSDMEKPQDIFFCTGDLVCFYRHTSAQYPFEYVSAVPVPDEEVPEKHEIHVACSSIPSRISGAAREFNRQSDTCRIVFDSYEQYLSDAYEGIREEYRAYTQLKNDILTGYRPDLIIGDTIFPPDDLAAQGLFCDLYSYLDSDPGFGRDALLGCVKTPFETEDGALPYLVTEFGVNAVCALRSEEEFLMPWNLEHVNALQGELPEDTCLISFSAGDGTPLSVLKKMLPYYQREAAENPEILSALLTFCKTCRLQGGMSTAERETAFRNGTIKAKEIVSLEPYIYMRERYQTFGGAELSLIGFPSDVGGASVRASQSIAVTKDAADDPAVSADVWDFVKMAVEYVQDDLYGSPYYTVSATKKSLEQVFSYFDSYYFWYSGYGFQSSDRKPDGVEEFLSLSAEEKQMLRDLYNGISVREDRDPALTALICEDASAYFAGAKPLEETVKIITGRAGLYLAERDQE